MTFLNLSLLAGGALIAVPIIMHLMMRKQPKQIMFPALRFVKRRQVANTQQLQLRHWLLLALRCAVLAIAALALARPTVASSSLGGWLISGSLGLFAIFVAILWLVGLSRDLSRSLLIGLAALAIILLLGSGGFAISAMRGGGSPILGDEEAPVAAVVILDTGPHMQYRQDNQTRLQAAQDTAAWLLPQLPSDSQVAVLDSSGSQGAFAIDVAAAENAVKRMQIASVTRPLTEVIERAQVLLNTSEKTRKEIYIVSDLTTSSWKIERPDAWRERGGIDKDTALYVIDIGSEKPKNAGLGELRLSSESVPRGSELSVETSVLASGLTGQRTVDLMIEQTDPTLPILSEGELKLPPSNKRGSETIELADGANPPIRFALRGLAPGVHHGVVRLGGEDGLSLDDIRYFTIEVEEPRPILIVHGPGVQGRDFAEAIAPEALRDRAETRFLCDVIAQGDLAQAELAKYEAVCLLDPAPLKTDEWNRLANFAREGGGIAIFLGRNAESLETFNEPAAQDVLGARIGGLLKQPADAPDAYLAPAMLNHPIFALFRSISTSVSWDRFPVKVYWPLDKFGTDTRVVANFSDGKPAIVELPLGKGRVLVSATPANDPLGQDNWNELWSGEDAWPWFVLLNESLRYVARIGEGRLNYVAGETAVLQNNPERHPSSYRVFSPQGEVQDVAVRDNLVTIRFNDRAGTYRLRGDLRMTPESRGFSSNLPAIATDLTRVARSDLDELFGKDRYQYAKSREELNRAVGQQRVGQELYPYVVLFIAFILGLEHFLANRFYQSEEAGAKTSWRWPSALVKRFWPARE